MGLKQEVIRLLDEKCSSFCLDNIEDRNCCAAIIADYIREREEKQQVLKKDVTQRSMEELRRRKIV